MGQPGAVPALFGYLGSDGALHLYLHLELRAPRGPLFCPSLPQGPLSPQVPESSPPINSRLAWFSLLPAPPPRPPPACAALLFTITQCPVVLFSCKTQNLQTAYPDLPPRSGSGQWLTPMRHPGPETKLPPRFFSFPPFPCTPLQFDSVLLLCSIRTHRLLSQVPASRYNLGRAATAHDHPRLFLLTRFLSSTSDSIFPTLTVSRPPISY